MRYAEVSDSPAGGVITAVEMLWGCTTLLFYENKILELLKI